MKLSPWHLGAAFGVGIAIGSFLLPMPRYTFYHFMARDSWTGKVEPGYKK